MRILFVVPYAPTPIRTRPYNLVRGLARRGHAVTLGTLYENPAEQAALCELQREGITLIAQPLARARVARNMLAAIPRGGPLQAAYAWHPALAAQLQEAASASLFDVIHVEHLRGARYALALKGLTPTVWDSVDCISHLFEQAGARSRSLTARAVTLFELPRTRRYEGWLVQQFARVLVTSDADKQALDGLSPVPSSQSHVAVLPNGVDLERFRPSSQGRECDTLVFSGKMSYHANLSAALHFAREVLPLVWRERPQTRLWIVGQNPPRSVRALAADPRITVTGAVADLADQVGRASVALCPLLYGAGIQNKVLEAMACGTPVVSYASALGAIGAQPERDVLAAESPATFAQQVLRLLADPALAARIGAAGRAYVETYHRWPDVVVHLENIYREARSTWQCHLQTPR
jgi:sugar transferase (PEP-CTERM/EpsH1 system associated)